MKTLNAAWNTLKDSERRQRYDAENGLLDEDGVPVDDIPAADRERPAADDECELCGSGPAAPVVLRQETGKIIWRTRRRMEGTFCRDCGLALFRSTQNRTLMTGWWGALSFFVNIGSILGNTDAWLKIRSLDKPRRDPAVVSYLDMPLDPGSPLYRRAGIWFAAAIVAVFGSMAAADGQQDEGSTGSYNSSSSGEASYTPSYGTSSGSSAYGSASSQTSWTTTSTTTTTTAPGPYPQVEPKHGWSAAQLTRVRAALPGNGIAPNTSADYAECALDLIVTWYTPAEWDRSASDGSFRSTVSSSIKQPCAQWGYPGVLIPSAATPTYPAVASRNGWSARQLVATRQEIPGLFTGPKPNPDYIECGLDYLVTWYTPTDWANADETYGFRSDVANDIIEQCKPWWR
jgi:hypothetical protein